MTTLEELQAKLDSIEQQQKEIVKGLTGFQIAFKGLQQVFAMLGPALAPLADKDFAKEMENAEVSFKLTKEAHAYLREIYNSIYNPKAKITIALVDGVLRTVIKDGKDSG